MPRRVALVVNPRAGGGRAARLLPAVRRALSAGGHDVVTWPTRSLAHADDLVHTALGEDRVVAALGGDGLVGRVAGAVAAGGGLLAVLPGGRGNDFARAVGIARDPVAACRLLDRGREVAVDLGLAAGRPYLGIASVGFDSAVQERVLHARRPGGRLVYLGSALSCATRWRPVTVTGTVDGAPLLVTGWSVAVANSGVYGAGMRLAPGASLVDGALDLVTVSTVGRARFLATLPRVFLGAHLGARGVRVRPAHRVELAADRPMRLFADGEPVGALPCTVGVRPAALRVLLPAGRSDPVTPG